MHEVLHNESIAPKVHRMVIRAPRVAAARQAGQFVIVRPAEGAERIPLTIADADTEDGTITLVVQALGTSTRMIVETPVGGALRDVAGPLGKPTHIENWGRIACVGGGVGTAVLYPMAKAAAELGNDVTAVIGGRTGEYVLLADELGAFCSQVRICTDDGSRGTKGFVTAELEALLADDARRPNAVFAVGPVPMMEAVCQRTRPADIPTIVSLNPIMVDGTGMCGGCRVTVGEEVKFACVDGPEFDGHRVDFDELRQRLNTYRDNEHCRLDAALGQSPQIQEER